MEKLSAKIKMLYGVGFASLGIKDGLFQVFLFFYFTQVLGLNPALTGTATIIALLFDAISDPLVGIISDKWNSKKWGRRHSFMLFSAVPLGVFIILLFMPPEGLGQTGLFWWLTVFMILVRTALTFFQVPAMSLGAELSTDYEERTSITSYRIMFGALISTVIIMIGFLVFFVPTEEYSRGLLNKEAYPSFAIFSGLLIIISILISVFGTKKIIPYLPQSENQASLNFRQLKERLGIMFKMKSYLTLIFFTMFIFISIGISTVFTTYFMEYYFELSETQMALLPLTSGLGGVIALIIAPKIGKKLDKKSAVIWSTIVFGICFSLPFNLRLLGFFPENGTASLLPFYFLSVLFGYMFLWVVFSLTNSMMADVIDEYDLKTNYREEGLFFASMSFAFKCTAGIGYFIAGLLLSWISFPNQVETDQIPQEAIDGLGFVGGPILLGIYGLSLIFILFYPLNKEKYQEIRLELDQKKTN